MASFKTFLLLLLVLAFLSVAAAAEPLVEVGNESFGVTVQSLEATPAGIHARVLIENLTRSHEVFLHLQANATDAQDYFFLPGTRPSTDTLLLPIAPRGTRSADVFFKLAPRSRPGVLAVGDVHPPFDQIAVSLGPVLERQAEALIAAAPAARPPRAASPEVPRRPARSPEGSQSVHPKPGSRLASSAGQAPPGRAPGVAPAVLSLASKPRSSGLSSPARKAAAQPGRTIARTAPKSLHATPRPAAILLLAGRPERSAHQLAVPVPAHASTSARLSQPSHGRPAPGSGIEPRHEIRQTPAIASIRVAPRKPPQVRPQIRPRVIFLPPNGRDHVMAVYAPPTRNFGRALILWAGHKGSGGYGWYRIHADHPDVQESQIGYAATYPHQIWTDGRTYLFVRWDVRHGVALVLQVAGDSIISAQWATYDDLVYWLGPGRIYPRLIYQGGR